MPDELIERFRQDGSALTYERLVESYRPLVYSVCRRYLRNAHDAEDATQETLMKLAVHAGQITGSVTAWLTSTAYSTSVDIIRKSISERRRREGLGIITSPLAQHRVLHESIRRYVHEALLELDARSRELIVGRFFRKDPLRLIAGRDGVSLGTVSRRVAAAMRKLAAVLRDMGLDTVDELTLAEHFGDLGNLPGAADLSPDVLRFAPDWNSPELQPQGIAGPVSLFERWSRPIRVGVVVSYASSQTYSNLTRTYGDTWMQICSLVCLPQRGLQLVGIVERGTSERGIIEQALREGGLVGGLIHADDTDALATLDVILIGNNLRMDPAVAKALSDAVRGGVGLLNEFWVGMYSGFDDPNVRALMLAGTPCHPYHTPGRCGRLQPSVVLRENPLLPGLKVGMRLTHKGCGPAYHPVDGAQMLMAQEMTIPAQTHHMSAVTGALPIPSFIIGALGRGRVAVVHMWPHQLFTRYLSISHESYFTNLIQWLAEPRKTRDD